MDSRQICLKTIKDNYWYGEFGDIKLLIDKKRKCFNATKLCEDGGENFINWFKNERSKALIDYLKQHYEGSKSESENKVDIIYKIGGSKSERYKYDGVYVHKDLITDIARWISPEFNSKVNDIVSYYHVIELNNDNEELRKKISEIENQLANINLENAKYVSLKEDITPKTNNPKKLHTFTFIKKNEYPYHIMITQNYDNRLKELMREYPDLEVIFKFNYDLDEVNFYNKIKQFKNIQVHNKEIKLLNNYEEIFFIRDIKVFAKTNGRGLYTFALIKKNEHPYYGMRVQRLSKKSRLNDLKIKYPDLEVLDELDYDPNAINLFNRIKEQFKNNIHTYYNGIKLLNGYSVETFINDIRHFATLKF